MVGKSVFRMMSAAMVFLLVTACSTAAGESVGVPPAGGTSVNSLGNSSTPEESHASTPPGAPRDFVVRYIGSDGSKFTLDFSLYPMLKAGDSSLTAYFPNGAPCTADPEHDAVFAGTLKMTNDTPSYSIPLELTLDTPDPLGEGSLSFGGAYGNGSQCSDANTQSAPVSVTLSNGWGPVRVEFVVRGAYSPGSPAGSYAAVSQNSPTWIAYDQQPSGIVQFTPTSDSGSVTLGPSAVGSIIMDLAALIPEGPRSASAGSAVCTGSFGPGIMSSHSIVGGTETDYDRSASLDTACQGFGGPVHYSLAMECAVITAVAWHDKTDFLPTARGLCDASDAYADIADHNWLNGSAGLACDWLADILPEGLGIMAAAGAASETGPGAVEIGVATYRALATSLPVICGAVFGGGAATYGYNLEAHHEAAIAADIIDDGKCLHMRKRFGYISWSSARC